MAKKVDGYTFQLFGLNFFVILDRAFGFSITLFDVTLSIGWDKHGGIIFHTSLADSQFKKCKEQERKERAERDKNLYGNTEWKTEPFDPKKKY